MRIIQSLLIVASLALAAAPAMAQSSPTSISGTIASFDGSILTVATLDGRSVAVTAPPDLAIGAVADRTLADIKAGDYVGSAAVKGVDGKLHALEVHIFAATQRGLGEGHRPMGPPDQTMTNATVAETARCISNTRTASRRSWSGPRRGSSSSSPATAVS